MEEDSCLEESVGKADLKWGQRSVPFWFGPSGSSIVDGRYAHEGFAVGEAQNMENVGGVFLEVQTHVDTAGLLQRDRISRQGCR